MPIKTQRALSSAACNLTAEPCAGAAVRAGAAAAPAQFRPRQQPHLPQVSDLHNLCCPVSSSYRSSKGDTHDAENIWHTSCQRVHSYPSFLIVMPSMPLETYGATDDQNPKPWNLELHPRPNPKFRSTPYPEEETGQAQGRPAHPRDRPPMPAASSNAGFNASRQLSRERVANAFAMLQNMADLEGSRCALTPIQNPLILPPWRPFIFVLP